MPGFGSSLGHVTPNLPEPGASSRLSRRGDCDGVDALLLTNDLYDADDAGDG